MNNSKLETIYIYLHGFASSPNSAKAKYVKTKMLALGHDLIVPDLNQDDFFNLTLTRELNQITDIIGQTNQPITLIGSSMGGLMATILAERFLNIEKLILLAPAFQMPNLWEAMISRDVMLNWQHEGQLMVFHYGLNKEVPLNYNFIMDLRSYVTYNFKRQLPSLIIHGIHDEVVPIEYSRDYAKGNKMAQLIEVDDDHSLELGLDKYWNAVSLFLFN